MNRSLKLFSVRGIDIRLHITFPLILVWAALQFGFIGGSVTAAVFGVVAISLLFVLVTLHELGHSFAALNYGVPVHQIVLTPIGGIAQLARMPENPVQEFIVAIAGPAVNFAFALIMGVAVFLFNIDVSNPLGVLLGQGGFTLAALFSYIFFYNIFLGVFNLLPAFPLDGGRVLRALMAMRLPYVKATNYAATIGRIAAVLLGLFALFSGSIFLVLIAVFIFMAGGQEAAYVRLRESLRGYTVQQVYAHSAYRLEPNYSLQQAANLMMYSGQQNFPVVYGERLIGFLPEEQLREAMRTRPASEPVTAVMLRDVQPVRPETELFEVQQRLSEEGRRALPVVDAEGHYLGLVTVHHITELVRLARTAPHMIPDTRSA